MSDILNMQGNFRRALHDIEDLKIHEDDYGKINKLQNILNSFVALVDMADELINRVAEKDGRSAEEVAKDVLKLHE